MGDTHDSDTHEQIAHIQELLAERFPNSGECGPSKDELRDFLASLAEDENLTEGLSLLQSRVGVGYDGAHDDSNRSSPVSSNNVSRPESPSEMPTMHRHGSNDRALRNSIGEDRRGSTSERRNSDDFFSDLGKLSAANKEIKIQQQHNLQLQEEMQELKSQVEHQDSELKQMRAKMDQLTREAAKAQSRTEELEHQLEEEAAKSSKLSKEKFHFKEKCDELKEQVADLRQEIEDTRATPRHTPKSRSSMHNGDHGFSPAGQHTPCIAEELGSPSSPDAELVLTTKRAQRAEAEAERLREANEELEHQLNHATRRNVDTEAQLQALGEQHMMSVQEKRVLENNTKEHASRIQEMEEMLKGQEMSRPTSPPVASWLEETSSQKSDDDSVSGEARLAPMPQGTMASLLRSGDLSPLGAWQELQIKSFTKLQGEERLRLLEELGEACCQEVLTIAMDTDRSRWKAESTDDKTSVRPFVRVGDHAWEPPIWKSSMHLLDTCAEVRAVLESGTPHSEWDATLVSQKVVEEISENMQVEHHVWQQLVPMTTKRDFCVLRYAVPVSSLQSDRSEELGPGAFVVGYVSISHAKIPRSGFGAVRGKIFKSGWVVRPTDNVEGCNSRLYYVQQLDLSGSMIKMAVAETNAKRMNCLAHAKDQLGRGRRQRQESFLQKRRDSATLNQAKHEDDVPAKSTPRRKSSMMNLVSRFTDREKPSPSPVPASSSGPGPAQPLSPPPTVLSMEELVRRRSVDEALKEGAESASPSAAAVAPPVTPAGEPTKDELAELRRKKLERMGPDTVMALCSYGPI